MNLGSCPRKKAVSPPEKITFNGKPSNTVPVRADFLEFEELCPAATTFFSGQAILYRMHVCVALNKRNPLTSLIREMKAVAF